MSAYVADMYDCLKLEPKGLDQHANIRWAARIKNIEM